MSVRLRTRIILVLIFTLIVIGIAQGLPDAVEALTTVTFYR